MVIFLELSLTKICFAHNIVEQHRLIPTLLLLLREHAKSFKEKAIRHKSCKKKPPSQAHLHFRNVRIKCGTLGRFLNATFQIPGSQVELWSKYIVHTNQAEKLEKSSIKISVGLRLNMFDFEH